MWRISEVAQFSAEFLKRLTHLAQELIRISEKVASAEDFERIGR